MDYDVLKMCNGINKNIVNQIKIVNVQILPWRGRANSLMKSINRVLECWKEWIKSSESQEDNGKIFKFPAEFTKTDNEKKHKI